MLEIEKKESKNLIFFQKHSSRLAKIISIIRTGRARAVEKIYITYEETDQQELGMYLEILVAHLNNPAKVLFGSNKFKEENETMKLQNKEVILKIFSNLD